MNLLDDKYIAENLKNSDWTLINCLKDESGEISRKIAANQRRWLLTGGYLLIGKDLSVFIICGILEKDDIRKQISKHSQLSRAQIVEYRTLSTTLITLIRKTQSVAIDFSTLGKKTHDKLKNAGIILINSEIKHKNLPVFNRSLLQAQDMIIDPQKLERLLQNIQDPPPIIFIGNKQIANWLSISLSGADFESSPMLDCYAVIDTENLQNSKLIAENDVKKFHFAKKPIVTFQHLINARTAKIIGGETSNNELELMLSSQVEKKTYQEIANMKLAHKIEGAIFIKTLKWLEEQTESRQQITEYGVSEFITNLRGAESEYICDSFPTIASSGPNSTIIHYRPTSTESRTLTPGIFLLDAGGHYQCGTTDATRTIFLGKEKPPSIFINAYTKVLKCHIHVVKQKLNGKKFKDLSSICSALIEKFNLRCPHGFYHGVGFKTSVHSSTLMPEMDIEPGIVISNEPGFYGKNFGIRIENLIFTEKLENNDGICFNDLTLIPHDASLINFTSLTGSEKQYLKTYHQKIWKEISPLLNDDENLWLKKKVRPFLV